MPINKLLFHDIIDCLVAALEAKDQYTSGHSTRVADMVVELATFIGLTESELGKIHIAAHLHDVGKIGISETILNKNGKLSASEWEKIKEHPSIGYQILCKSDELKDIAKMVLYHHERWDGKGYPQGLAGSEIPLGSRMIALCDAMDAMTSQRAYREALSIEETISEIMLNKGLQFDPNLVEAVTRLMSKKEEQKKFQNIISSNKTKIDKTKKKSP